MSSSLNPLKVAIQDTPSTITAAAEAYTAAMRETPILPPGRSPAPTPVVDTSKDVLMADATPERAASPAILPGATNAPSPIPARVGTPSRNTNGNETSSRAASLHPDPAPTIPKEAPPHGAPTRQYLNGKVTGPLMDGMKLIAKEQPKDPLRALGEYLLQRSREIERS